MKRIVAALSVFVGLWAAKANTYLKTDRPEAHASPGAQFLLRLDVPAPGASGDDKLQVPATILRFVSNPVSYQQVTSFSIKCSRFPQKVLITPDGDRFIAINYNMPRDGSDEVIQVFDARGKLLKMFTLADVYLKADIASYWEHDKSEVGTWLDEASLTDKNSVWFKCRDVLGDFPLHDYLLDLATLKITVVGQ